jgi:hypothetical protein
MGLIPSSPEGVAKLEALGKGKIVFPVDEVLGLDRLPFKISAAAMLEIVWWVQMTFSYEAAKKALTRHNSINVSDVTIRSVTNTIGEIIYINDTQRADEIFESYNAGKLTFPTAKKNSIFYIEVDGSMVHTRKKYDNDSSWRENKLGIVFTSDNIRSYRNKKGELCHKIGKREYIPYLGDVETFKKHLFAAAIRNGYGECDQTVIVSDGALWIKNMKDELFPDATQILDFYHLCEHLSDYAKIIFNKDENLYKPWVSTVADYFKDSQIDLAVKEIEIIGKKKHLDEINSLF